MAADIADILQRDLSGVPAVVRKKRADLHVVAGVSYDPTQLAKRRSAV